MDLRDYNKILRKKGGGKIMRIDSSLAEEINNLSRKNQITFIDASREIAYFMRKNANGRKNKKEIIKIIKNVEF